MTLSEVSEDEPAPPAVKKRRPRKRRASKPASPAGGGQKPAWSRLEDLLEKRRLERELADFEDDSEEE